MTSTTNQYSPFQQELLNNLCQINTNVSTLINVFVNLQSHLKLPTTSQSINTIPTNTKNNISTNSNILLSTSPPRSESKPTTIPIIDAKKPVKIQSNIHSNPIKITNPPIKNTEQNTEKSSENPVPNESKIETKIDDAIPLSLDSSDTDEENDTKINKNNNNNNNNNISVNYLSNKYKHRNRFGLNRSKSSTQSASMTTLLRANHIRNHKYNGILKSKYKHKKSYDQKSDSHVKMKKNGPKFDPEHVFLSKNNRIIINVGGSLYETTLNTLSADQSSMLSAMFSGRFKVEKDENGSIFIDRDPTHFRHILNFLRDGIEYLKHGGLLQQPDAIVNELLQEAKYYNIRPLVDYIQLQQTRKNKKKGDELTHEKQYKLVANISIDQFEDVFNKYTGSAGYDFEEWLFVSPYKTSRNSSSQPYFTMLFSKKLSRAEVRLLDRLTNIDFQ